jgi:hypothetical protein
MDFIVEDPIILETTIPTTTTTTAAGGGVDDTTTKTTYQMEWIPVNIVGQSFLLNQIRKMIWLAIEIARGALPDTTLKEALQRKNCSSTSTQSTTPPSSSNHPTTTTVIPRIGMAPAQGLFLDMSYYKKYNEKIIRSKNHKKQTNNDAVGILDWHLDDTLANDRWKVFRNTVITQHIAQEEVQCGNFLQHIYMEEHRSYFYTDFNKEEDDDDDEENDNDGNHDKDDDVDEE